MVKKFVINILNLFQIALKKEQIRSEISSLNLTQADMLEEFLARHKKTLHATNSYVIEINYALTQLYDDQYRKFYKLNGSKTSVLNEEKIKRRIELCRQLLSIADKIDPGFTKWRGQLLLSLQEALLLEEKLNKDPQKEKKEVSSNFCNFTLNI